MFVRVYACMCIGVHTYMYLSMWRPEIDNGVFLNAPFLLGKISDWTYNWLTHHFD